jgi:L-aspartate oxidase
VRTDLQGRSSLQRLYAAGEAACTGVHGANRLASNSLLEGLVFGARAGQTMRDDLDSSKRPDAALAISATQTSDVDADPLIRDVQQLMWNKVGIVRTRQAMSEALQQLQAISGKLPAITSRRSGEAANIHTAALLITRSAMARLESRGAHYRTDYPAHDDARFKKHSIAGEKGVRFS